MEDEKVHAEEVIKQAQTPVATRDRSLEELKPLQVYLDAFHEALNGELPFSSGKLKKMLIGLMTEYIEAGYKALLEETALREKNGR